MGLIHGYSQHIFTGKARLADGRCYYVITRSVVAQRCRRQIRQPERVIQLTHHQQTTIRAELRGAKIQSHARVEIYPICPLQARIPPGDP